MTLQAKVTFNKTISLPPALFQRWQAFVCFHPTPAPSFNGYVIAHLEASLPPLRAIPDQKEAHHGVAE